jgi:dihydrolipoamide dehydrogenase
MQSSLPLSFSPTSSTARSHHSFPLSTGKPLNLRFCGLRREALGLGFKTSINRNIRQIPCRQHSAIVSAARSDNGSTTGSFDYDLLIIGAGVGGHGAALHAVEKVCY